MKLPGAGTRTRTIMDDMIEAIQAGVYPPGSCLPSRSKLCTTYKVSPVTAQNAMAGLQSMGYIQRQQGVGSVVLDPCRHPTPVVHRWRGDDLLREILRLNQLTVKWMEMAERDGFLHPATIAELPNVCFDLRLMADRLWQQRQQDIA